MKKVQMQDRNQKLVTHWNPTSPISESYRTLRTNIQFASIGRQVKSILVTSSQPGEGKTTTSANLAIVMGQAGKKTVYVDADLRRPSGFETFHLSNLKGVTSYLVGQDQLNDVIQDSGIPNVSVITSGPIPPNPAELLGSEEMGKFIDELKILFDLVIIDCAPTLAVADSTVLSTMVDGCLLVIHSGKTNEDLVRKAKNQLQMANARIMGVVLNNMPQRKGKDAGYYYYQTESTNDKKSAKKVNMKEKVVKIEKKEKKETFEKEVKQEKQNIRSTNSTTNLKRKRNRK